MKVFLSKVIKKQAPGNYLSKLEAPRGEHQASASNWLVNILVTFIPDQLTDLYGLEPESVPVAGRFGRADLSLLFEHIEKDDDDDDYNHIHI